MAGVPSEILSGKGHEYSEADQNRISKEWSDRFAYFSCAAHFGNHECLAAKRWLQFLQLDPADTTPDLVVLILHGLGSDVYDSSKSCKSMHDAVRILFPTARILVPKSGKMGIVDIDGMSKTVPAWYDRQVDTSGGKSWKDRVDEKCVGFDDAIEAVQSLIREQLDALKLPATKCGLIGFSMGGAMTLASSMTWSGACPLGGAAVLGGYLPMDQNDTYWKGKGLFTGDKRPVSKEQERGKSGTAGDHSPLPAGVQTPLVFVHGGADNIVPWDWAKRAQGQAECWKQAAGLPEASSAEGGSKVELKTFGKLDHAVPEGAAKYAAEFLASVLS